MTVTYKPQKPFDPSYDYTRDLTDDDIRLEDGKQFVYLRGLEKLAKARGVVSATCQRLDRLPDGMACTYRYQFVDGGTYDGSADATIKNCDGNFKLYCTAMAESRSKARALRTAFGISLCSVEEKSDQQVADTELGPVEEHQAVLIRHLATKHGLGKPDIIGMLDLPRKISKVEDLTKSEAIELISKLNSYKARKKAT